MDGDAPGSALWSHTFKKDPGNIQNGAGVWRLAMAEGRLIASAENDEKIGAAENVGSWARELAESAR
ncbi:hypothetical protein [Streptomyces sp. NPDC057381]|uniref:hypothetical protein n=1 Tax=unclassified Streptomyces TaxID=2593676 RepID=UPI00363685A3